MVEIFSKKFKEGQSDLKIDSLIKRFTTEIKALEKEKTADMKKYKHFKKKNASAKFQKIAISLKIDEKEYEKILTRVKNIIINGGVDSMYKLSNRIERILNEIDMDTMLLSELINSAQEGTKPAKTQNPNTAQVKDLTRMLVKTFLFTYSIEGESSVDKSIRRRHQINELSEINVMISKLKEIDIDSEDSISQINSSQNTGSQGDTSGEESSSGGIMSGISKYLTGRGDSNISSSAPHPPFSDGPPPGDGPPPFRDGPPPGTGPPPGDGPPPEDMSAEKRYQMLDEGADIDETNETDETDETDTTEKGGVSSGFYDTVLSYFTGDSTEEKSKDDSDENPSQTSASDIVRGLDLTGLFSKDKRFVPNDNDTQKIEIAESELKMLHESEESLRQELEEQSERIKAYKKDIQNKISQQYALLEYEKSQLRGNNKITNRKQYEQYVKFVDMLKNRERFLDKREDILNHKRKKDLKELNETKKTLVSELLRQLDKEKTIVIKSKNKENSILREQLKYYKGNNMYLQSLVNMLESRNATKSETQKIKRTLRKRKKDRSQQYTNRKIFEITL